MSGVRSSMAWTRTGQLKVRRDQEERQGVHGTVHSHGKVRFPIAIRVDARSRSHLGLPAAARAPFGHRVSRKCPFLALPEDNGRIRNVVRYGDHISGSSIAAVPVVYSNSISAGTEERIKSARGRDAAILIPHRTWDSFLFYPNNRSRTPTDEVHLTRETARMI
eukprot:scaffold2917_cov191-Amphora_coffeaeformis.AAC.42